MKKRGDTEKLLADIKNVEAKKALIITLNESKNDEKIHSAGIEILNFDISNYNGKIKLKKYLQQIKKEDNIINYSVYGNVNEILEKNKINFNSKDMIVRYTKLH